MAKVSVTFDGAGAEVALAAPPLNLFDAAMLGDLEAVLRILRTATADGTARAVLLRAEGKVFCGGVDVHDFQGLDPAAGALLMARMLGLTHALEALPVPTLAVVHGLNLTIGFELCLGCDLLWAADDARFGLVEATVGLTPAAGGTQRLVARAGVARAAELVLTGNVYPAAELREWGVVNRTVPAAELLEQARTYAAALAAGPTAAAAVGKRVLRTARDHGTAATDAITPGAVGTLFDTADLPAGIATLLKDGPGKARFSGR